MVRPEPNQEVARYLNVTLGDLRGWAAEQLGEGAVLLARYAHFLQVEYNRQEMRVNWCEAEIKRTVGPDLFQQKGYSYEERKLAAVRQSGYAMRVNDLLVYARGLKDELAYLSSRVEFMGKAYMALQQTKGKAR